jgi:F0F1-type ATP synthase assembly protein I
MAADKQQDQDGGIIRWEQLSAFADKIRTELSEEITKVERGQALDHEEIAKLRTEVAGLKTEMRIAMAIMLVLLSALVGLFVDHLAGGAP